MHVSVILRLSSSQNSSIFCFNGKGLASVKFPEVFFTRVVDSIRVMYG